MPELHRTHDPFPRRAPRPGHPVVAPHDAHDRQRMLVIASLILLPRRDLPSRHHRRDGA